MSGRGGRIGTCAQCSLGNSVVWKASFVLTVEPQYSAVSNAVVSRLPKRKLLYITLGSHFATFVIRKSNSASLLHRT